MVAIPGRNPNTSPLLVTKATDSSDDVHEMARLVSVLPAASRSVTTSCTEPLGAIVGAAGVTVTLATGGMRTVIVDDPVTPSTSAMMIAVPAAKPVTSPLALTVATFEAPLRHVTVRPLSALPFAARAVALS